MLSEADREELDTLGYRFAQTAALAKMVSAQVDDPPEISDAVAGIAETLSELSDRFGEIVERVRATA